MRLSGKVAVVTGAGSGIGRAIALGFVKEGANVLAVDLRLDAAEETVRMAESPNAIAAHGADVSNAQDVAQMVRAAEERFGAVNVLVNNAAIQLIGQDARAHELEDDVWEKTMAVNLRGPYLCIKHVIPAMLRAGGGSIVNLASPTGFNKGAGYTAYSTSKGGLSTLTRVVALDYARDKIRCNAIVPGATETPLITSLLEDPEVKQRLETMAPLGRLGRAADLVPLAVYLAADESSFSTGAHFFADGGSVMH